MWCSCVIPPFACAAVQVDDEAAVLPEEPLRPKTPAGGLKRRKYEDELLSKVERSQGACSCARVHVLMA